MVTGSLEVGDAGGVLGTELLEDSLLDPPPWPPAVVPGAGLTGCEVVGAAGVPAAGAPGGVDAPLVPLVPPGPRPAALEPLLVGTGAQPVSLDVPVTTVAVSSAPGAGFGAPVERAVLARPTVEVAPVDPAVLLLVVLPVDDVAVLEAVVPGDEVVAVVADVELSTVRTGA